MNPIRVGRDLLLAVAVLAACTATPTPSPSPSQSPVTATTERPTASPTASPTPTRRLLFTPTPLPTSHPAAGLVTHENPILGYRIDLPEARRRSSAGIAAGSEDGAGQDFYSATTEAEDRAACLMDGGHLPSMDGEPILYIGSWRNPAGLSAEVWATTPRSPGAQPLSTHMLVKRQTIEERQTD